MESRNAYSTLVHPKRKSDAMYFVRNECSAPYEPEARPLDRIIADNAARLRFLPIWRIAEIESACSASQNLGEKAT
ncbi:MAG: hypothetical protein AAF742_00955 [Pseudomonadota bacterium]